MEGEIGEWDGWREFTKKGRFCICSSCRRRAIFNAYYTKVRVEHHVQSKSTFYAFHDMYSGMNGSRAWSAAGRPKSKSHKNHEDGERKRKISEPKNEERQPKRRKDEREKLRMSQFPHKRHVPWCI